jgi:hypothetical protein
LAGLKKVGWGRDLAERFELYQIVLNRVDLKVIAIPVYANL